MSHSIHISKLIGMLAVTFALMPWVGFGLIDIDSQPWPLLGFVAFLASISGPIRAPKNFWMVLVLLICGIVISLVVSSNAIGSLALRAVYNYLGVVTFFIGFYNYLLRYGFPLRLAAIVNLVWLLFGFIELYSPGFVSLFSPVRTSDVRGVTSLAPEPTFFAIYLFFSSWLLVVGSKYRPSFNVRLLLLFNVLSIFFLAKSSMGILYLGLSLAIVMFYHYFMVTWNKRLMRNMLVVFLGLFALMYALGQIPNTNRYISLGQQVLSEVSLLDVFRADASLNARLEDVVYSIHGSFYNFLIPGGFDTFKANGSILEVMYNDYFWYNEGTDKIMSWIGDFMYQLGIFGVCFIVYLFYVSSNSRNSRRLELILLGIILVSAVPLAFPLVMMVFATFYWDRNLGRVRVSNVDKSGLKLAIAQRHIERIDSLG